MNNTKFKQTEIGLIPEDWEINIFITDLKVKGRIGWKGYKTSDLRDSGPMVLGGENIKSFYYLNFDNVKHIVQEKFDESPEIIVKPNDILLVTRGNLGEVAHFKGEYKEVTINPSLVILSEFIGNSTFLYYYLLSPQGKSEINSIKRGSSVPAIYQSEVKKIKYPVPSLPEQKAIAKILSDLDSKIELNQQMNKTLEEIGKTLFKRWFVDFEFPNEHGKPYKSSGGEMVYNEELKKEIPKGWGIDRLDKLISRNKIKIENYDFWKDKTIIDLSNMPQKSISLNQWDLGAKFETNIFELNKFDILYGSIRPYFGKAGVSPINGVVTGSVFSFLPKNQNYYSYIVFLISSIDFIEYTVNYSQGTKMPIISWSDFVNYDCVLPADNKLTNEFNIRLYPLINLIVENIQENNTLAQTRDLLLPKLMSGKIRVKYEN